MSSYEGSIQLPPDSTGKRFRLVEVTDAEQGDGTGYVTEWQEVVTLADASGNIIGVVDGGSVKVSEDEVRNMLLAIVTRLDLLNAAVDSSYTPPDNLGGD